ncbi:MAG: hypothetical protein RR709_00530 [Ruthenibacterium sp.]
MARNYCGSCGACLPEHAAVCPKCGRLFETETAAQNSTLQEPDEVKMLDDAADAQEAETLAEAALLDGEAPEQETPAKEAPKQEAPVPGAKYIAQRPPLTAPPLENPPHYARITQTSEQLCFSDYFGMLMIALIPIVGLVMLCIWSFGEKSSASRRNLARAILLVQIVMALILLASFCFLFVTQLVYFNLF